MRNTLRKTGLLTAAAAAALFAAPAPASAAPAPNCHRVHQQATGNFGILTGNNIYLPLDLNLAVTDNAVALLGLAGTSHSGDTTYHVHCGN